MCGFVFRCASWSALGAVWPRRCDGIRPAADQHSDLPALATPRVIGLSFPLHGCGFWCRSCTKFAAILEAFVHSSELFRVIKDLP